LLNCNPIQGARLAEVENGVLARKTAATHTWGRSCESLQTRFQNQQNILVQSEGMQEVVAMVAFMRTLRRANAWDCDWLHDPDLDMSVVAQFARTQLRQSPCFETANATFTAAQDLPTDEHDVAHRDAMLILLSENCTVPEVQAETQPEVAPSDDEVEEEIDETTDDILYELTSQSDTSSLLQQEILPILMLVPFFIPFLVVTVIVAISCGMVLQLIRKALLWIWCSIIGGNEACTTVAPMTWLTDEPSDMRLSMLGPVVSVRQPTIMAHVCTAAGTMTALHTYLFLGLLR